MIKVYDLDRLLADVEMIDGKIHVMDYDGLTAQFIEDLRPRERRLKAILKSKHMGLTKTIPESEWEPVSDQELYDAFSKHLGGFMWTESDDYETIEKLTRR